MVKVDKDYCVMNLVTHIRMAASSGVGGHEREKFSKNKDSEYDQQIQIYLEYIFCFTHILSRKVFFTNGSKQRDNLQDHIVPVLFKYLAEDLIMEDKQEEGIKDFYRRFMDADNEYGKCEVPVAPLGEKPSTKYINYVLAKKISNIIYGKEERLDIIGLFSGAAIIDFNQRIGKPNVKKYIKELTKIKI